MTERYEEIKEYINPGYDLRCAINHLLHTEKLFVQEYAWPGVYKHLPEEHFFNADKTPTEEQFRYFVRGSFIMWAIILSTIFSVRKGQATLPSGSAPKALGADLMR